MTVRDMVYDVKFKLNKVDSQKYSNLKVPEINWALNEAEEIFIKTVSQPRFSNKLGFEHKQRSIDDVRTIVVNGGILAVTSLNAKEYLAVLPNNYRHFVSSYACASKGNCSNWKIRMFQQQHDDLHEENIFTRSSFEWEQINFRFYEEGIKLFTDGTFTINSVCDFNYIRKTAYIHNAADFIGGSYKTLDGVTLTGTQDCELPEHTHREIVDLAVLILTGSMQIPDYEIKKDKINLLNI